MPVDWITKILPIKNNKKNSKKKRLKKNKMTKLARKRNRL